MAGVAFPDGVPPLEPPGATLSTGSWLSPLEERAPGSTHLGQVWPVAARLLWRDAAVPLDELVDRPIDESGRILCVQGFNPLEPFPISPVGMPPRPGELFSYSVTGCGTDFLQWKWAEMDRAVGEVAA